MKADFDTKYQKIFCSNTRSALNVFFAQARDSGTPSLGSVLSLSVELLDENDNAPRFASGFHNVTLMEEEWPPQRVATLTAIDGDAGENGRVTYSIAAGNDAGVFYMDAVSGVLETQMKVDREAQDRYALVVQAQDHVSSTSGSQSRAVIQGQGQFCTLRPPNNVMECMVNTTEKLHT